MRTLPAVIVAVACLPACADDPTEPLSERLNHGTQAMQASPGFAVPPCRVTFVFGGVFGPAPGQNQGEDPDLSIGTEFWGSYTFDGNASRIPQTQNTSLDWVYPGAISRWSLTFRKTGIKLSGSAGDISVGNDTDFFGADHYVATFFNPSAPVLPSGRQLRFAQLILFNDDGSMLTDDSIQESPPDPGLARPGSFRMRFTNDDQPRGQLTYLEIRSITGGCRLSAPGSPRP